MKKAVRRTFLWALILALCASGFIGAAFAAEKESQADAATAAVETRVQLNGEFLEFTSGVDPYFDEEAGVLYIPFRDFAEALGWTVGYNSGEITATFGTEKTVRFRQDETTLRVTEGTDVREAEAGMTPVTVRGRVLVSPGALASVFRLQWGRDDRYADVPYPDWELWTDEEREAFDRDAWYSQYDRVTACTAIFVDTATLLPAGDANYTVLDKLFDLRFGDPAGKRNLTLDLDAAVTVDGTTLPITLKIDALTSGGSFEGTLTGRADLTPFVNRAYHFPGLTVSAAWDFDARVIFNAEEHTFYLKADALNTYLNEMFKASGSKTTVKDGAWLMLELDKAGVDMAELYELAARAATFKDAQAVVDYLVQSTLDSAYHWSDVEDYARVKTQLAQITKLFDDASFQKDGDTYTSKYEEKNGSAKSGCTVAIKTDAGGSAVSVTCDVTSGASGSKTDMHLYIDKTTAKLKLTRNSDSVNIALTLDAAASVTDKAIHTVPPLGAPVQDVLAMIDTVNAGNYLAE